MRKHVTPANLGARIPDAHGGFLSATGQDVEFNVYWIERALRGDVIVGDPIESGGDPSPPPPSVLATDVVLLRRGGITIEVPLTTLAAFLGSTPGATTPTGGTLDFSDPANSGQVPGL